MMQETSLTTTVNNLPKSDQTLLPTRKVKRGGCLNSGPCLLCTTTPRWFGILLVALLLAILAGILVLILTGHHRCTEDGATHDNRTWSSVSASADDVPPLRLSGALQPHRYELTLRPDFYNGDPLSFRFSGKVIIIFKCMKWTQAVVLHSKDLDIDTGSIRMTLRNGNPERVTSVELDPPNEMLTLHLREALQPGGTYGVTLSFAGSIKDNPAGMHYMSYEEQGQTKYVVATQMQPAHARSVFPCMDEPGYKATFDVIIERKRTVSAMSNMPIKQHDVYVDEEWTAEHFDSTPRMSTCMVAIVLSPFRCRERTTNNGQLVQICSRTEFEPFTDVAAGSAVALTEFYEEFHNISLPLKKITHVALPNVDLSLGGAAYVGLVTYMEEFLLYDSTYSTTHDLQQMRGLLAHEIAHQWFGNLVTLRWWDDFWLNEGLATFMEILGTEVVFPAWHTEDGFLVDYLQIGMAADALATSHPVHRAVKSSDHVDDMMHDVTYRKAACVIRMMYYFLGSDSFRGGVMNYFRKYGQGSATHQDFFNALTQQAVKDGKDLDVGEIMRTWILQQGFPIITFEFDRQTHLVNVTQKMFLLSPSDKDVIPPSPYSYLWHVPISYITSLETDSDSYVESWLRPNEELTFGVAAGTTWVLGNVKWRYYYRVNYDEQTWSYITEKLRTDHRNIAVQNRAQLLDDSINLARAGEVSPVVFLNMSLYLLQEEGYMPWVAALRAFDFLDSILATTATYTMFKTFVTRIVQPVFENLPPMNEAVTSHVESLKREALVETACFHRVQNCIRQSSSIFHEWHMSSMTGTQYPIPVDIRYTVFSVALTTGSYSWNRLFEDYLSAPPEEQKHILLVLGHTNDVWQLRRYLRFALEGLLIPPEHFTTVLTAVTGNPQGPLLAWEFLINHWDEIYARFNTSTVTLKETFEIITTKLSSRFHLGLVEAFLSSHSTLDFMKTTILEIMEDIRHKAEWREQHLTDITQWFETSNIKWLRTLQN